MLKSYKWNWDGIGNFWMHLCYKHLSAVLKICNFASIWSVSTNLLSFWETQKEKEKNLFFCCVSWKTFYLLAQTELWTTNEMSEHIYVYIYMCLWVIICICICIVFYVLVQWNSPWILHSHVGTYNAIQYRHKTLSWLIESYPESECWCASRMILFDSIWLLLGLDYSTFLFILFFADIHLT